MPAQSARRRPLAVMWPPAGGWREHLCMLAVRDTRSCELEEHEQLNRFPANPYCCITWMLEGKPSIRDTFVDASQVLPVHGRQGVNIGLRLAGRLLGVGPRQVQRLARREGGMNARGLSRLWRGERSLRMARDVLARGQAIDWAATLSMPGTPTSRTSCANARRSAAAHRPRSPSRPGTTRPIGSIDSRRVSLRRSFHP